MNQYQMGTAQRFGAHRNERYDETPGHVNQKKAGVALGTTILCLAIGLTIFNLGFIIPSLIFADEGSPCVTVIPDGFTFNLATWLRVDAYTRIGLISLLLLVAIVSCCNVVAGLTLLSLALCLILLYSLFSLAWTIVGAIMFWGRLNPAGYCSGGVQIYMWIFLIISFIGICLNCFSSLFQGKGLKSIF